jgi:RNA polymerase-binding protein DksA
MPLKPQQAKQLRALTEERRRDIIAELQRDVEKARGQQYRDLAGPAPDAGDASVADLISDLENAEVTRDVAELRALEQALSRMTDGSYGVCVQCGGEIALERLRANPAALRCLECQHMFEKTHASSGGSTL